MKWELYTNFEKHIYFSGFFQNLIASYAMFFLGISFITLPLKDLIYATIVATVLISSAILIFARFTHLMVSTKLSKDVAYWNSTNISREERSMLFSRLHKYPIYKAVETFIVFFINGSIADLFFYKKLHIDLTFVHIFIIIVAESAYFFAIYTLYRIENQCTPICQKLISQGIDFKNKEKPYFISTKLSFMVYTIIPLILSAIVTIVLHSTSYRSVIIHHGEHFSTRTLSEIEMLGYFTKQTISKRAKLSYIIEFSLINIFGILFLSFLNNRRISSYTKKMKELLIMIRKNRLSNLTQYPVDLFTEASFSIYLINNSIDVFNKFMEGNNSINNELTIGTKKLIDVSTDQEIQVYSLSANVEEILVTMQNLSYFSRTISTKIGEVINVAAKMSEDIEQSFSSLNKNLYIMKEITDSNNNTIEEINLLSKKIHSIQDIVNIIDSISEQTKIIAFNAELESNKINSSQNKFYNVTTEIRKLADTSIELTKKIKNQIRLVQMSADGLINASQNCMEKINEGNEISEDLNKKFTFIIEQSKNTATYSKFTEEYIDQQSSAFYKIAQGLNQVNYSIRTFRDSTESINRTVESLKNNSLNATEIKEDFTEAESTAEGEIK